MHLNMMRWRSDGDTCLHAGKAADAASTAACISLAVVQGARAMSSLVAGLWMSTHFDVLLSTNSPLMTFLMVGTAEKKRARWRRGTRAAPWAWAGAWGRCRALLQPWAPACAWAQRSLA